MASTRTLAAHGLMAMEEFRKNPSGPMTPMRAAQEQIAKDFFGTIINPSTGRPDPNTQAFIEATQVLAWLYAQAGSVQRASDGTNRFAPGVPQRRPQPASKFGQGPPISYGALDHRSVILYCDVSRYRAGNSASSLFDTSVGLNIPFEREFWEQSKDIIKDGDKKGADGRPKWEPYSLMYALCPATEDDMLPRGAWPSTIQLNPSARIHFEEIRPSYLGWKTYGELRDEDFYRSQPNPKVFFRETLDTTLFHELAHTCPTVNVQDDGGYFYDGALESSTSHGQRNADNVFFFAFFQSLLKTNRISYNRDNRWGQIP